MLTDFLSTENVPLTEVSHPLLKAHTVRLFVKRDDLIHPYISGNKWRKLKYNISEMQRLKKGVMLTFGGAYSNHILAVAAAGNKLGFKTIGMIRGEEPKDKNPVLLKAEKLGMQLHYVSREEYRKKETKEFMDKLQNIFGDFYLVPEGGANEWGVKGCEEIVREIKTDYSYICCSSGTGATVAGIALSLPADKKAIGFCVHRGGEAIAENIKAWTGGKDNYILNNHYHFRGFAKSTPELTRFLHDFSIETNIPVEPVYTGKMFFGIFDLVSNNFFKPSTAIVAIHTGGIHQL
jgi:1-aminocyclopropane-1-carboxylate deaminase/D-cysteine desulfhydrase-like pyridoxal-dependent ACC family enzyme